MNLSFDLPCFGEKFSDEKITADYRAVNMSNTCLEKYYDYCKIFEKEGFTVFENYKNDKTFFTAFKKGESGVFINFFKDTNELEVVLEENSKYFTFSDNLMDACVQPQITQLHLEDFGMSYAIRLCDGRFIIIDGGREFEPDAKRLFEHLKGNSIYEKPIIAAWIFTHPHDDHFHCFLPFTELYGDKVIIEKMLFNFPEVSDIKRYPSLAQQDFRFENNAETVYIPMLLQRIKEMGVPVYTPHTGQNYHIGGAELEILACIDDTAHSSSNLNMTSLVIMMSLGGQKTLWAADASFYDAKLCERYGELLKADILQVPHHGFSIGSAESEIKGYELIKPETCLLPVNDFNAFTAIDIYAESTLHLMTRLDVSELITGEKTRTIHLPYHPEKWRKEEVVKNVKNGFKRAGASTWVFTGLNTSRKEDFIFTFLNMSRNTATINAEIFFEETKKQIRFIKISIPTGSVRKMCITDENSVDSEYLFFNWLSLKTQGIPENVPFAVRFISNVPVVISNSTQAAAYYS